MDRSLSRSMPLLPLCITYRAISPGRPERSCHRPRHYYLGGVRTQLIGADSYPNRSRSPRRLILCGANGSYQKLTRSSSTAELSRTGVYSYIEYSGARGTPRRAASCEDVRGMSTTAWDSRLSESGVSLNDSRTDMGSCVGLEDVDAASQCSFGSSSAFHEFTCDSDSVSVPGSGYGHDRTRDAMGHDSDTRARRRDRSGGGGQGKSRHDSGSREKFLAELNASSGRSSPREEKEFYHSTPTKRGSPILSIFPGDEEDLHFPSNLSKDALNQSSVDSLLCPPNLPNDSLPDSAHELSLESLPMSPKDERREKARQSSVESIRSSMDTVREALRRRRQQFFASFNDCSNLEQHSTGESVETWLTTGHPQPHAAIITPSPLTAVQDTPDHTQQPQQLHQPPLLPPPSPGGGGRRLGVRDRVRAIEQGPDTSMDPPDQTASQTQKEGPRLRASGCSGENGRHGAASNSPQPVSLKEGGGAEGVSSQQLYPSPRTESASPLSTARDPPRRGDVHNEVSPARRELASGRWKPSTDDKQSSSPFSSSSSFGRNQNDEKQASANRAGQESGALPGPSEENNTCLQMITTGPVTSPAARLSGTNYRAVSADDRLANAGANTNTTHPPLPANNAVSGLSSASPVYRREGSGVGVKDRETNVVREGSTAASFGTGIKPNTPRGSGDAEKTVFSNGDRNRDTPHALRVDSDQGRDSERLESGFSDQDNSYSYAGKDQTVTKDSSDSKGGQDTPLYHARPIQIVSPEGREKQSKHSALYPSDAVTPSSHTQHPSFPPHEPSSSPLLHESHPPSHSSIPMYGDQGPGSAVKGHNSQPVSAVSRECQQDVQPATAMDQHTPAPRADGLTDHSTSSGGATKHGNRERYTRHVQRTRTTVQEMVTTVRHYPGPLASVSGEGKGRHGEGATGDAMDYEVIDQKVSRRTVTERDSDEEEIMMTGQPQTHQPTKDAKTKARSGQAASSNSYILDDLQEQLSNLSSEGPHHQSRVSPAQFRSPFHDHAEASLPHTQSGPTDAGSASSDRGVARGAGSVFFTLDRHGPQEKSNMANGSLTSPSDMAKPITADWETHNVPHGPLVSDPGHGTSLYRAEAVRILPSGEKVILPYSEGRDDNVAHSPHTDSSSWGLTGSSSEINDSDDRCTSVSLTDGCHPHDSEGESRTTDDTTAHTFQDFLSGLDRQFTSDQPSRHRSVDLMADDFRSYPLRSSFVQETILEADDENETTDEDTLSPTIHNFKSSLHFCVPQSTPAEALGLSAVPKMDQQSKNKGGLNFTSEDRVSTTSYKHHTVHDSLPQDDPRLSLHHHPDHSSCTPPSGVTEQSGFSSSVSAQVRKTKEDGALHKLSESSRTRKLTTRRLSPTHKGPKKAQWVQEKVLLFQKLLNDLESQSKTSEQKVMEEMMDTEAAHDKGHGAMLGKQSEVCDDLYRLFTREHLEKRQSHQCPFIEDHMPAFRFRRFLRKKHNSKLKGQQMFRVRHQMAGLMETSVSEPVLTQTGQPPYHIHHTHRILSPGKLRGRVISDVFTDDADVTRSISSDSAYSSLSGASSRNISDLDSTFRSVCGSRADVSSLTADVSMDDEKMRSLSDVFDHMEVYEGDIDQARLDRLQVGHTKAGTL